MFIIQGNISNFEIVFNNIQLIFSDILKVKLSTVLSNFTSFQKKVFPMVLKTER